MKEKILIKFNNIFKNKILINSNNFNNDSKNNNKDQPLLQQLHRARPHE